ncbi:hypothetical protein VTO42DRAFT_3434 [Malbranchea cinnamomea]
MQEGNGAIEGSEGRRHSFWSRAGTLYLSAVFYRARLGDKGATQIAVTLFSNFIPIRQKQFAQRAMFPLLELVVINFYQMEISIRKKLMANSILSEACHKQDYTDTAPHAPPSNRGQFGDSGFKLSRWRDQIRKSDHISRFALFRGSNERCGIGCDHGRSQLNLKRPCIGDTDLVNRAQALSTRTRGAVDAPDVVR